MVPMRSRSSSSSSTARVHGSSSSLRGVFKTSFRLLVVAVLCWFLSHQGEDQPTCLFVAAATLQETEFVAVDVGTAWLKVAALRRLTTLEADGGGDSPLALERKQRAPSVYSTSGTPKGAAEQSLSLKNVLSTDHRIEIVLNDQANRKSPPCVAFRYFRNDHKSTSQGSGATAASPYTVERFLSEQAQALAPRMPSQVVCSPTLLLEDTYNVPGQTERSGESCDGNKTFAFCFPSDQEEAKRGVRAVFFPHQLGGDAAAAQQDGDHFSPEELTSMLLAFAAAKAELEDLDRNRLFFNELLQAEKQQEAAAAKKDKKKKQTKKKEAEQKHTEMAVDRVRRIALALPASASLSYRQAMLDAASLAGLHVPLMTLTSSGAVAQLALLRGEELFSGATNSITESPKTKYVMLYDMGSRLTEVSVWAFSAAHDGGGGSSSLLAQRSKKRGSLGRHHVHQVALEVHPSLGGEAFDRCIAQYWDRTFFNGRILAPPPTGRATAAEHAQRQKEILSLLRGAQRAREMLSAIKEAAVTIEGLSPSSTSDGNGGDSQKAVFTTVLQRDVFERECAPLFSEAVAVRDAALQSASATLQQQQQQQAAAPLTMKSLARFEVVGGCTRMPKLLQDLSTGYAAAATAGVVDRTLNGDEAAVLGTAHLTAVALGQLSAAAPLPFQLHPYLSYNIGYLLTPLSGGGRSHAGREEGVPRTLFAAKETYLPSTKTIHFVFNHTAGEAATPPPDPLLLTLLSPPEEATLAAAAAGTAVELRVTPQSYLKHYAVPALHATVETVVARALKECPGTFATISKFKLENSEEAASATKVRWQVRRAKCTMQLNATELYLEVRVSESGFPLLQKSFVKVGFEKTITEVVEVVEEQIPAEQPDAPDSKTPGEADKQEEEEADAATPQGEEEAPQEGEGEDEDADDTQTDVTPEDAEAEENKEKRVGEEAGDLPAKATAGAPQNTTTTIQHIVRVQPLRAQLVDSCQVHDGQSAPPCPSLHVRVAAPGGGPARTQLLTREEKIEARQTLLQLDGLDRERLRKSSLRNQIESVLIHIKTSDFWYAAKRKEAEGAANEAVRVWRERVTTLADWLEDEGEQAGVAQLEGTMAQAKEAADQLAAWELEQEQGREAASA